MRRRTKRIILGAGAVAAGLVIALVLLVLLAPDAVVKFGVERAASFVLGAKTRIAGLTLSASEGTVRLDGLTVENPTPWSGAPYIMTIDTIDLAAGTPGASHPTPWRSTTSISTTSV